MKEQNRTANRRSRVLNLVVYTIGYGVGKAYFSSIGVFCQDSEMQKKSIREEKKRKQLEKKKKKKKEKTFLEINQTSENKPIQKNLRRGRPPSTRSLTRYGVLPPHQTTWVPLASAHL